MTLRRPGVRAAPLYVLSMCTLAIAAGLVLVSGARPRSPAPQKRHAILILLDAARADRFGFAGYPRDTSPNLDRLAERGLVFERHFVQATATRASLPQLLYSRYFIKGLFPHSDSVALESPADLMRRIDRAAVSIPRALERQGFATAAISAHSWLKPHTRFGDEFQQLIDLSSERSGAGTPTRSHAPPSARVAVDRAIAWTREHRAEDTFLYLHLMDTHFPHAFGDSARTFFGADVYRPAALGRDGRPRSLSVALDEADRRYLDALYDGSVRDVDRELGRLFDELRALGIRDDTLIAVTADHGEHLMEVPGRFAHGGVWYDAVARVPWLLIYPRRVKAGRIATFSEGVDLLPTILAALDVQAPPNTEFDGIDQLAVASGARAARQRVVSPEGIRDDRFKLVVSNFREQLANADAGLDPAAQLFDLERDPAERDNRIAAEPDRALALRAALEQRLSRSYQRFEAAIDFAQPDSAFAIEAQDFELDREPRRAPDTATESELRELAGLGEWSRSTHWKSNWIFGPGGAAPIRVGFAVPDGRYAVRASVAGTGRIAVSGGRTVAFDAPDTPISEAVSFRSAGVDLGEVEIRDRRFGARVEPGPEGSWMSLRRIGLRPLGTPRPVPRSDEAEYLQQLRVLGYVD